MRTSVLTLVLALALPAAALAQEVAATPGAQLGSLDHRIESLRAELGRTDARLQLLLGDESIGAARIAIRHDNHMSRAYRLTHVQYALDGQVVFTQDDANGSLAARPTFDVYAGALMPGPHVLTVGLEYLGDGYGVFDYAHGYHYRLRSSYTFDVPPSGDVSLHVIGWEDGATGSLSDRPALRFQAHVAGRDER